MSILSKYNNNVNRFTFKQVDNPDYKSLKELYKNGDVALFVGGLFVNTKSKFGDSPVAVCDGFNVNLPNHLLETVKEMINDDDVVELANKGDLAMEIYEYETKKWGKSYSVNFKEKNELPF